MTTATIEQTVESNELPLPTLELKTKEWVEWGITTFAEFDAAKAAKQKAYAVTSLSDTFMGLMYNITHNSEVANKHKAMLQVIGEFTDRLNQSLDGDVGEVKTKETGVSASGFSSKDYLVNQSSDPTQWKYPLVKESGKYDLDAVNLAVDLLQKEYLSTVGGSELMLLKSRLSEVYGSLGVVAEQQPNFVNDLPPLFLWKEMGKNDVMRWMMIYSNNALDRDQVEPNLFKEKSHKAFAELANAGILPMPEAWVWHVPGTRWGVADHLMVLDGNDGFVLPVAFGTVDVGMEQVAENLFKEQNLLVSHGTPRSMVLYDETDKRLIEFAPTIELSPLPSNKAANIHTAFLV